MSRGLAVRNVTYVNTEVGFPYASGATCRALRWVSSSEDAWRIACATHPALTWFEKAGRHARVTGEELAEEYKAARDGGGNDKSWRELSAMLHGKARCKLTSA